MKFLLDTMVWVWLCQIPEKIPSKVLQQLQETNEVWALSAVSPWEVARKAALRGKNPSHPAALDLGLPFRDWFRQAWDEDDYLLLPLSPEICAESNDLPGTFHDDPMDQIIVATARIHDLTVVTTDRRIKSYSQVKKLYFKATAPQTD